MSERMKQVLDLIEGKEKSNLQYLKETEKIMDGMAQYYGDEVERLRAEAKKAESKKIAYMEIRTRLSEIIKGTSGNL